MTDQAKPLLSYVRPALVHLSQNAAEAVCANGSTANLNAICNAGAANNGAGTCRTGTGVVNCLTGNRVLDAGCTTGALRAPAGCRNGSAAKPGCVTGTTALPTGNCNIGNGV